MNPAERRRAPISTCISCGKPCSGTRCDQCGVSQKVRGYELLSVLGRGASGCVYRAKKTDGQLVAVKELWFAQAPNASDVDAFEREMELLKELHHPSIPRLVEAFQDGQGVHMRMYIAQELIEGEALGSSGGRLEEDAAIDIADRVLAVLEYLQGRVPPIIHRDIKPANLIRRSDETLALVDFGSARLLPRGQTNNATLTGTFGYMPLEQLGGTVDTTTDLYALGATLVHLLSGIEPWNLFDPVRGLQFEQRVRGSRKLLKFLERLVARRPQDRFADAFAAREALKGLTGGGTRHVDAGAGVPPTDSVIPAHPSSAEQQDSPHGDSGGDHYLGALEKKARRIQQAHAREQEAEARRNAAEVRKQAQEQAQLADEAARREKAPYAPIYADWMAFFWPFYVTAYLLDVPLGYAFFNHPQYFPLYEWAKHSALADMAVSAEFLILMSILPPALMFVILLLPYRRFVRFFRRPPFKMKGWKEFMATVRSIGWDGTGWVPLEIEVSTQPSADAAVSAALVVFSERTRRRVYRASFGPTAFDLWSARGAKAAGSANFLVARDIYRFLSRDLSKIARRTRGISEVCIKVTGKKFAIEKPVAW